MKNNLTVALFLVKIKYLIFFTVFQTWILIDLERFLFIRLRIPRHPLGYSSTLSFRELRISRDWWYSSSSIPSSQLSGFAFFMTLQLLSFSACSSWWRMTEAMPGTLSTFGVEVFEPVQYNTTRWTRRPAFFAESKTKMRLNEHANC